MSGEAVLGKVNGVEVTIDETLALLDRFDDEAVIGELDGESVTVGEFRLRLLRTAAMPKIVPIGDRLSDQDWAEAVIDRGEAPYGRCPWCRTAKGAAGCLNLCDMPAAAAAEFTGGLLDVINKNRAHTAWLETLGGCTCGPAHYFGYQTQRDSHEHRCPMG